MSGPISLTYYTGDGVDLSPVEQSLYGKGDVVRQATRAGIRRFVAEHRELLTGRVLDYGCGKQGTCAIPQPYRSMLAPGTDYVGWEPPGILPAGFFNGILCTQVLQNVDNPWSVLEDFRERMEAKSTLVLTYPVAWEEIEQERWRFTKHGMWALCHDAGLRVVHHECLVRVVLDGALSLSLVNGLVARKEA